MKDAGIYKVYDLLSKPEQWIRKEMGINGVRLVNELKGIPHWKSPTLPLKIYSRNLQFYGDELKQKEELQERICSLHFGRRKPRKQKAAAKYLPYLGVPIVTGKGFAGIQKCSFISLPNPVKFFNRSC